ncbi:hypothetical protein B0H16DRAFT_1341428, partial [Mycena metata]
HQPRPRLSGEYLKAPFTVMDSENDNQHANRHLNTGIVKATLFSALPRTLPVPRCLGIDIMHLILNIFELFTSLWRGIIDCDPADDVKTWPWAVL